MLFLAANARRKLMDSSLKHNQFNDRVDSGISAISSSFDPQIKSSAELTASVATIILFNLLLFLLFLLFEGMSSVLFWDFSFQFSLFKAIKTWLIKMRRPRKKNAEN
jgi:hypothetical protein